MTSVSFKVRIWCETDSRWEVWNQTTLNATEVPPMCNAAHTRTANSFSIVKKTKPRSETHRFGGETNPYCSSTFDIYKVLGSFVWRGTKSLGVPSCLKVRVAAQSGKTASVQIYDRTNALVVCEKTGITRTSFGIEDLGTITNAPLGEATFEVRLIQGKVSSVVVYW